MTTLHTLSLAFDLKLRHRELPGFRGAMAALAGLNQDLFHNHNNAAGSQAQFKQRYPLIQYRVHHGHAAIFALNAGALALEKLVDSGKLAQFAMNGRARPLELAGVLREPQFLPQVADHPTFRYRISQYLAFSPERFAEYKASLSLVEKISLLERTLRNHIVAFAWGAGWQLPEDRRISVVINDLNRANMVPFKGQQLMAFDLVFSVNARLPEGIGLGRKPAFGFGATIPLG